MDKVKNIVETGLFQGWARDNIISQIKYEIATKEEADLLFICGDDSVPELTKKAETLFEKYREEYYKTA